MTLCYKEDSFVANRSDYGKATWIAIIELPNGKTYEVFQDDERYGPTDRAWLRLKEFIENNDHKIKQLVLKFRGSKFVLPENGEGYFFCNRSSAIWGGPTSEQYVVGVLKGGMVYTTILSAPDLRELKTEIRLASSIGQLLITNG